jgi:hypothetical protein
MAVAGLHFFLYSVLLATFPKGTLALAGAFPVFSIPTIIFIAIFDTILNNHFG